jgi:hypothetical protein
MQMKPARQSVSALDRKPAAENEARQRAVHLEADVIFDESQLAEPARVSKVWGQT